MEKNVDTAVFQPILAKTAQIYGVPLDEMKQNMKDFIRLTATYSDATLFEELVGDDGDVSIEAFLSLITALEKADPSFSI